MENNSDRKTHTSAQKYAYYTLTSDIHTDENFALCRAAFIHLFLPKMCAQNKCLPLLCIPMGINSCNCDSGNRDLYLVNPIYITASILFGLFWAQVSD